jgi:hypothetical protein
MQPHSAMHRRAFARTVGRSRKEAKHLKYEYIVAFFNPCKVKRALADWVACAEGQNRITKYIKNGNDAM